jgi:two-component system phosphate regulon response regulator PhoB
MAQPETHRKKILIVDDEPDVVTYLATLLEDNGYETVEAKDGVEGLARAREVRPDLVTLDISMPRKSGVRMYREMREDPSLAEVPVVVVTAVTGYGGDPEAFHKFLDTRKKVPPPEAFVAKPIERQALLDTLARVLAHGR